MHKTFELVSDLHLDFYGRNEAYGILESWTPQSDILVIAGDLCEMRNFDPRWIEILRNRWPNIIVIPGNHEYYGLDLDPGIMDSLQIHCHVLNRRVVQINGIVFAGCTLWFPHPYGNRKYEHMVADFSRIGSYCGTPFHEAVSIEHNEDKEFLGWAQTDVWVTHHMPFAQSIHPKYAGQPSNRFFYAQCDDLIDTCMQAPKVVVHGHTHEQMDYKVDNKTHVVCNPMGYPSENGRYEPYTPRLIKFNKKTI